MAITVDFGVAKKVLAEEFAKAENDVRNRSPIVVPKSLQTAADSIFGSSTQSYREVLIGCMLARIVTGGIDIRKPYINQGDKAFSGRSLDEHVVNPFLQDHAIPCSKGPYLAVFRRRVSYTPGTRKGLKDKTGFDSLLVFITALEKADVAEARTYLRYVLSRFIELRERAIITVMSIDRLSLDQHSRLIDTLLSIPSQGVIPVLLAVAMFRTIKTRFNLDWDILFQGINVADKPSGAGGDLTIKRKGDIVLAVEITERPLDRSRVVSIFNTKISPNAIDDYLFFFTATPPTSEARTAAHQYFSQGHDISFLRIRDWLINCLGTLGPASRSSFTKEFVGLLSEVSVSASLKVAWNEAIKTVIGDS